MPKHKKSWTPEAMERVADMVVAPVVEAQTSPMPCELSVARKSDEDIWCEYFAAIVSRLPLDGDEYIGPSVLWADRLLAAHKGRWA
jgi:hypothetical protein